MMRAPRLVQVVALSVVLMVCFAATALALADHTLTSITPDSGANDGPVSVTVYGNDFEAGETLRLKKTGESDINGTSVVIVSSYELTCNFGLTGVAVGAWDVSATNGTWGEDTLPGAFTVTPHKPVAVIDSITPNPEFRGQSVTFTGHGTDALAHTIDAHEWQSDLDGQIGAAASFSTSALTRGDHTIEYRVQCSAGAWSDWTAWDDNPLVIQNNPPTVAGVFIEPDPAYATDDLTADTYSWLDADGDPEGYDYVWEKNTGSGYAVIAGETAKILSSANFTGGNDVRVTCTPNDGFDTGAPVTDEITISNSAPSVASVDLTPDPAYTNDDLLATPSGWNDPDGDPEGYYWDWHKDTGGGFVVIPGETSDTLGSANFVKGDVLRVTCTPNDGFDTGAPVTDEITIGNTAPTVASVAITPDPAYTTDDLLATPSGWNDADGDPEGYDYQWAKEDGTVKGWVNIPGATSNTLASANFTGGDQLRVTCTPNDGTDTGAPVSDEITISNTPPTVASVDITPDPAYTTDDLLATPTGWNDADGDPEGYDWAWEKDTGGGFAVIAGETTNTLGSANFTGGDEVRVTATPNDGFDTGAPVTDEITIGNTAPTVASVDIAPDPAGTGDDLLATPTGWNDADGDPEGYDWQWEKDTGGGFAVIGGETTDTLGSANFAKGDVLRVTCTPNDGTDTGAPVTDEITIGNAVPTVASVDIAPANPTTRDSFRATASGSTDADGDPVTYSYQWYKNGVLQVGVTWRTIGSSRTRPGQTWRCVATPNDGADDGPTGEATVTINGKPTAPTVTITPDDPTNKENLVAHATGSADPDGDAVTYVYRWFKDGVAQPDLTGMRTIRSWRTRPGQVWRVVATPTDGVNNGPTGEATVTINTRPGPPTVVINPQAAKKPAANPTTNDNLPTSVTCNDPDGDNITYAYQWYKNGVLQSGVTWRSIGAWRTRVGQEWTVVVTPSDLHGEGKPGEVTVVIEASKSDGPITVTGLACVPSARGAEVAFTLSANASVTCEVLNIAGRAVKTIVADRPMEAGVSSLAWDGRNAGGLQVPAGMYLVRMTATGSGGARWTSMGTLNLTR